nr:RecX family transcriptional regulator [uncultured Sphingomonas sp.]
MIRRQPGKPRPPLDATRLDELALTYVGRFATSRAKLTAYLRRKLRERGWAGEAEPNVDALVERLSRLGYVDDRQFAMAKARSLTTRGYGRRRVNQALGEAGIAPGDGVDARDYVESEAVEAALRFARRRRMGPFGSPPENGQLDSKQREKNLAAMLRAGHGLALAKTILDLPPGEDVDPETLR